MTALITLVVAAALAAVAEEQRAPSLDSLADEASRGTTRFADRRVAIAEGYRRVGADFPGMGEHWVHPGMLLSPRLDAARPAILAYATIDGRATLLGVGFIVTTRGESTPVAAPGWPHSWHEHSGLLADESGARTGRAEPATTRTRVWVLHVWTALPNPANRFDAENWALPFARAGIAPPHGVDAETGRALSLAVPGGDDFLRGALGNAGLRTTANAAQVDAIIARASAAAADVAMRARASGGRVAASDLGALRVAWRLLGEDLRAVLGAAVEPLLVPAHPTRVHSP